MIKILYNGIGATKNEHTEEEFLTIMKNEFTDKNWDNVSSIKKNIQLQHEDWILPKDFAVFKLMDWLEYSGANIVFSDTE
jgi:hypothetical protein